MPRWQDLVFVLGHDLLACLLRHVFFLFCRYVHETPSVGYGNILEVRYVIISEQTAKRTGVYPKYLFAIQWNSGLKPFIFRVRWKTRWSLWSKRVDRSGWTRSERYARGPRCRITRWLCNAESTRQISWR